MHLPTHLDIDVSAGEQYVAYRCERCGYVAQASVACAGTGLRVNGLAVSQAGLDARVGAEQAVRLVPCPRCGHRDRIALAKVLATGSTVGSFAALAAGLVAAEQLRNLAADADVGLHVGVATFLAVVATMTAMKLRSVRRRVRFQRVVR